jgi:hypothetical protein
MPVTHDTEDRDMRIMTGTRCRAGVGSLRLGCAYGRTVRGLDIQLVLVVLVDIEKGIATQPDQLGIVVKVSRTMRRREVGAGSGDGSCGG